MRYSSGHKAEIHRRIVAEAARQFRERGLDAVSVADVMAGAGLTHGGFYAHFDSKEALIAEALGSQDGAVVRAHVEQAPPGRKLEALVRGYLSAAHRARRAQGCVVAALGTEAGRHSPQARRVLAQRSRNLAALVRGALPLRPGQSAEGLAAPVAACLVGGLILARLEDDPAAANRILEQCQDFVLNALAVPHDPPLPGPNAESAEQPVAEPGASAGPARPHNRRARARS